MLKEGISSQSNRLIIQIRNIQIDHQDLRISSAKFSLSLNTGHILPISLSIAVGSDVCIGFGSGGHIEGFAAGSVGC